MVLLLYHNSESLHCTTLRTTDTHRPPRCYSFDFLTRETVVVILPEALVWQSVDWNT